MNKKPLEEILKGIKIRSFVKGYKASDEEAMGILLSHYFDYGGLSILKATYNALEDGNYHTINETIQELIDKLEKE